MRRFLGSVLRRLLAAAGLARTSEVERRRRAVRADDQRDADRRAADVAAKVEGLTHKVRAARERAALEHAQQRTLRALLSHYLVRLAGIEEAFAARAALDRRVQRAQLELAVKATQRRGLSPAARAESERLAARSVAYQQAVSRWRSGHDGAGIRRVAIAGLQWSAPSDAVHPVPDLPRTIESWLPVDDLATVRRFAVGGLMLDIGAGVGATSVPRVLLGDFLRAYAAEPDEQDYLCLVGNTLDNHLEGRVLPDRIAVAGGARRVGVQGVDAAASEDVQAVTADAWVERLGIDPDEVRFIRIGCRDWNVDVLRGAGRLLKRRHIIWQMDLPDAVLRAGNGVLHELTGGITAHFTHVKALGRRWLQQWVPASETQMILSELVSDRRGGSLVLFNLPDVDARERPLH